jgi:L-lactate utilization protein LutC
METEKRMPSAVTLIAGHSRTGDIELIIVSGVHGPGRVYVAAVDTTSFSAGEKNQ